MTSDILKDAEFALLVAATARPSNEAHRAIIAAAARPRAIDWRRFLTLVDRHRVAPLVFASVNEIRDRIPASFHNELRSRAVRDRAQALQSIAVLGNVMSTLAAAEIEAISIKGPVLAKIAFGEATLRQSRDIDILISPEAIEPALAALSTIDCYSTAAAELEDAVCRKASEVLTRDLTLVHRPSGILIELHWRLNSNPMLLPIEITQSRQTIELGRFAIGTLDRDELTLYLSIHGARHLWSRLKWLADLYALLAPWPTEKIIKFYQHGVDVGLRVPVGQMLLMLHHVYGMQVPDFVLRQIQCSRRTSGLSRIGMHFLSMVREVETQWYTPFGTFISQIILRSEPKYIFREVFGYCIDLPTLDLLGRTRLGYTVAILGRPLFWVMRRLVASRLR